MFPSEISLFLVNLLGLTEPEHKGLLTVAVLIVYFMVLLIVSSIIAIMAFKNNKEYL